MTWQVDLIGERTDIAELKHSAPFLGANIVDGVDGRQCLSGDRFDGLSTPEEVRVEAGKILLLLNGLARLGYGNHRSVQLGSVVSRVRTDGQREVSLTLGDELRTRVSLKMTVNRGGTTETIEEPMDRRAERTRSVVAKPELIEITAALGGEITWQILRVIFEKIVALVGNGNPKNYDPLLKARYTTRDEIDRFKANVQDPRVSGLKAVHGVPTTHLPPRGAPMGEQDGLAFVTRIFNDYLDHEKSSPPEHGGIRRTSRE